MSLLASPLRLDSFLLAVINALLVKGLSFRRTVLLSITAVFVAALLVVSAPDAMAQNPSTWTDVCPAPASVLTGVYEPSRLAVLNPCQSFSGTVDHVTPMLDGDYHVDLMSDPGYEWLLNGANEGLLVVEIMPRDLGRLAVPSAGEHLKLAGAYVNDTETGWNELHPVWAEWRDDGSTYMSGP